MAKEKNTTTRYPASIEKLLKKGNPAPMPKNLQPMLATLADAPVDGPSWQFEMKWDGYRAIAYLKAGSVNISSRNNKSFDEKFYPIHKALSEWPVDAIVDGEIVVLNSEGIPDFSGLQQWRSEADGQLVFYAFDLLWFQGISLLELALEERRKVLEAIMPTNIASLRLSQSIDEKGTEAFAFAQNLHLEGIMAKKKDSVYMPGTRTKDWLKIKTEKRQEFVIGGYTKNEGTNKLFSALLVGVFENGVFHFVSPVGTGFNRAMQKKILDNLKPLVVKDCPFATVPDYNKPSRFRPNPPKASVTWVKPEVVAEISYREMTKGGAIRHPSFKGLRDDKPAEEVVLEKTTAAAVNTRDNISKKMLRAPAQAERNTLLNPKEETQTRNINGHDLRFTNLSKLFWKKEKISKREMINYYFQMAPFMLPYMKDRPQTLNRHPHGIDGASFYQKDVKGKAPDWIERFPYYSHVDKRQKEFLVCSNEASLLYIASLGCIEMNPWHSRKQNVDHPDWCIIDLDPAETTFQQVIDAANVTRSTLDTVKVPCYCKTSGSTGLHIYIPLGAKYSYEDSKEFGRRIAKVVHHQIPGFTSIERKTADRNGKMYVDFLQNRPQATVAAVYSLRPKPGAPVSMPLHWSEVKKGLKMTDFNIKNAVDRVRSEGDLFRPVIGKGINMEAAIKRLHKQFEDVLGKYSS